MKRLLISGILLLSCASLLQAGDFERWFEDATLRLDYVFCGNASKQEIFFSPQQATGGQASPSGQTLSRQPGHLPF